MYDLPIDVFNLFFNVIGLEFLWKVFEEDYDEWIFDLINWKRKLWTFLIILVGSYCFNEF
jgi:hypothetical protein